MDVNCIKMPYTPGWHYIPNVFPRSAAFHAPLPKGKRFIVAEPIEIAAQSHYTLKQHAGEQLDQGDLDILLGVTTKLAQLEAVGCATQGDFVSFQLSQLFYACARTPGNYASFLKHFERLSEAMFTASFKYFPDAGLSETPWSLIELINDGSWEIKVRVSNEYRKLFALEYTGICDDQRRQLLPDGQWLHAFFSSHSKKREVSPLEIGRLIGRSPDKALAIEPMLIKQFAKISAVTGWECKLELGNASVMKKGKEKGYNSKTKKAQGSGAKSMAPDGEI